MGIRERLLAEPGGLWLDKELGEFVLDFLEYEKDLSIRDRGRPSEAAAYHPDVEELYAQFMIERGELK